MKPLHAFAWSLAGLLCLPVGSALGQEAIVEGPGHKVGEGTVLHPRVGVETGYVSNVFYEDTDEIGAGILRLVAELDVASLSPQRSDEEGVGTAEPKVEFRFGAKLQYEEYLSDNNAVTDQRNLGGGLEGKVVAFPKGQVRFTASDTFVRHTRPVNFEASENLNRDVNRLLLQVAWHPTRRTIDSALRYENTIDRFESENSAFANRLHHTIGLKINWRYLPVTRFYFEATQGFYGQLGDELGPSGMPYHSDSLPMRLTVGAASAITDMTTLKAHAGFAAGFYDVGPSYTSAVYGAEFGFRYSPLGRFVVGFDRDFKDSINANYYSQYELQVRVEQQVSRVLLIARAIGRLRDYEGVPAEVMGSDTTRSDTIGSFDAELKYRFRDWLAASLGYLVVVDDTEFTYQLPGGAGTDDPSYVRSEVTVGVTAAF